MRTIKKGLEVYLLVTQKRVRRSQIACVNDMDFYSNGDDCIERTQEIIQMHAKLYKAI